MKSALVACLVFAALVAPAVAQNAGEIARTRAGANCPHCNLFQADLGGLTLKGRNYSGARLRQADLSLGIFNHTRFTHADLRDINAYGALFTGADLSGADLTHASFVGAYLEGASLRGARTQGTDFSGAQMQRARGLTQSQLDGACGDRSTRLPYGLHLAPCRGGRPD